MRAFAETIGNRETDFHRSGARQNSRLETALWSSVSAPASNFQIQRSADCACGGSCPTCQAKHSNLPISQPGDVHEKEADRVADRVMRMSGDRKQNDAQPISANITPVVQAKSEGGIAATSELTGKIAFSKNGGSSLDGDTQSFMQSRFGADFSGVKIHTGTEAVKMSRELNARAFTVGKDIYFNEGEYRPNADKGKRLLAHELTHTIQQNGSSALQPMIQRDLAVDPTAPDAVGRTLTPAQIANAIAWNRAAFSDADEISLLRDVLGLDASTPVIDEVFINALVQYQANYGLTQDGLLGAGTARRLADELRAEGDSLGAAANAGSANQMATNTAERRMRLRARVVGRLGRMLHQGFVGPRDNPTGVVSVRSGFTNPQQPAATNTIGINYTGGNADNSRWVQFGFQQMSAINPATRAREYQTGAVTSTAGAENYSTPAALSWTVDTTPAGTMYYESGGTSQRVAGAFTEIFDQPRQWNGEAETYAASFATRPAGVRLIIGFDTYLIVNNNRVVYHVRYNIYFNFNTSVSPTPDVPSSYEVLSAGEVRRLPAALKTVLDARFPGNTVP